MLRALPVLVAAVLLSAAPARAQLFGTYTINPALPQSGSNFQTVGAAVTALRDFGVSAPVTFEVAQATYTERVTFNFSIPGASATNRVTFLGISAGAVRPVIRTLPTAGQPWVWRIEKAQWLVLDNLAIEVSSTNQPLGTVLQIEADDITVQNCEIESIAYQHVGASDAVAIDVRGNRVRVEQTSVVGGAVGIRYSETGSGPATGGQVLGNTLDRSRNAGILVEQQAAASGNAITIRNNFVDQDAPDRPGWVGIHLRDHAGGAVLARNRVIARTGTAVRIEDAAAPSPAWISVVNTMAIGSIFAVGPSVGIDLVNADRVRVHNNSVYLSDDTGAALIVDAASSVVDLRNNILVHDGEGPLLDVASGASLTALDFQVYYASESDTRFRARWQGADLTALPALQTASGRETSGIVWPVVFASSADLHLAGRSVGDGRLIGTPLPSSVTSDYDGEPRNGSRPYRGADEAATPLTQPPPLMSGTYDINLALPTGGTTYQSFADAVADLDARGVGGSVVFRVAPGTYSERVDMGPVPGASAIQTIRFEAASGTPLLRATAGSIFDDFVVRLTEVEHVTFAGLEFRSLGTTFADVAELLGGRAVAFEGCTFRAMTSQSVGTLLSFSQDINQDIANTSAMRVQNSTFVGGRQGISLGGVLSGASNVLEGGHEIVGNTFTIPGAGFGIRMTGVQSGVVRDNTITILASGASSYGVHVGDDFNGFTPVSDVIVEGNEIRMADGTGIRWERYRNEGAMPPTLRLANNTVRMSGNGAAIGIDVRNPDGVLVAHNTASVAGTSPLSAAARVTTQSAVTYTSFTLLNNVLDANLGRALDLDLSGLKASIVFNHNTFSSQGAALASYHTGSLFDGDCATIQCIRAASASTSAGGNQDLQSNVLAVAFADAPQGNLRLAPSMNGNGLLTGTPLPAVATDLDGDARSATAPYRGADEAPTPIATTVQTTIAVLLQGAIEPDPTFVRMRTSLAESGALPLSHPYGGAPWFHTGTESVEPGFFQENPGFVDWVLVGIRATPDGPDLTRRALLLNYGGQVRFGAGATLLTFAVPPGTYTVVVYHRNHLPIASVPLPLSATFTTAGSAQMQQASYVLGGMSAGVPVNALLVAMTAGDADADGSVLAGDRQAVWLPQVGQTGYLPGDLNLDGNVLADDRQALWAPNVGRQSNVPGASLAPTKTAPAPAPHRDASPDTDR